LTRRKIFINLL